MLKSTRRIDYCKRMRKVAFKTELDAKIALAQRLRQDKGEIRYYPCPVKHHGETHFHLTSQDKRSI